MRTSPLGMRRRLRRAPLLLSMLALVVALGAACTDDGGDDDTSPTTTSPTPEAGDTGGDDDGGDGGDDGTTTAPPDDEPTTTAEEGTDPTGESAGAEALSPEAATAELVRIFGAYRAELQGAQQRNALDEQLQAGLAEVLAPALRDTEVAQLQQIGVPASLPAEVGPLAISDVEVLGGGRGCTWGSATIDFTPFYGEVAAGPQTYFFRLAATDGAYRLDSLGFTESGEPYDGLECEG